MYKIFELSKDWIDGVKGAKIAMLETMDAVDFSKSRGFFC
jgi:hypothetical protein